MRAAWLVLALGVAVAHAALCADGVNICSDVSQFCCCVGGPAVCTCCALATDACAAGVCVPASATPTPTPTPPITPGVSQSSTPTTTPQSTVSVTRTPSPSASTTRTVSPSRTPSLTTGVSASTSAAPSPSACAVAGIAVAACNASTALIVGDTVVAAPLTVPPATQIVVADGSLTVAAPVTFSAGAPPIVVLNGTLVLAGDVVVRSDGNATRVVLFVVGSDDIDVAANFSASTDATCVDAVADESVRGEFAVLLVPSAAKSCTGRHASSSPTALWALTAIGGVVCVCAVVCVAVAIVVALFASRSHALRWLFFERERADDSVVHSGIVRGEGRERKI